MLWHLDTHGRTPVRCGSAATLLVTCTSTSIKKESRFADVRVITARHGARTCGTRSACAQCCACPCFLCPIHMELVATPYSMSCMAGGMT